MSDRLAIECEQLAAQQASGQLTVLAGREAEARAEGERLAHALDGALARVQSLRAEQLNAEARLESERSERERARAELLSLEALQKAALSHNAGRAGEWLKGSGLAECPRLAETLGVATGWERAVETALGDYLDAVCVDALDELARTLDEFASGRLTLLERHGGAAGASARESGGGEHLSELPALASKLLSAPTAAHSRLAGIFAVESLADALALRGSLRAAESIVTRTGEWVGPHWVRVSRGHDQHAGVIEREFRLKALRGDFEVRELRAREMESRLNAVRQALAKAESERDGLQARIQGGHREHSDLLGQLEASRARSQESALRRERLDEESAEAARERDSTQDALARARLQLGRGLALLADLDSRRPELEGERDERRECVASERARGAGRTACRARSSHSYASRGARAKARSRWVSVAWSSSAHSCCDAARSSSASSQEAMRRSCELESRLDDMLARRLEVEAELAAARRALEEADAQLRSLDEQRQGAEQRVQLAREAMEQARLAAQETRVRREAIAEQFAATQFELAQIQQGLAAEANVAAVGRRWASCAPMSRSSARSILPRSTS